MIMLFFLSFRFLLSPVMTTIKRSPSTKPVWSPCLPPVQTNNLWFDCTCRWREEEEEDGARGKQDGVGDQKMRDGRAGILIEGGGCRYHGRHREERRQGGPFGD